MTVLRSFVAALLPFDRLQMYEVTGLGWANGLLGFIALVLIVVRSTIHKFEERIKMVHDQSYSLIIHELRFPFRLRSLAS